MACLILRKYKGEMEKINKFLCDKTDYKANKNVLKLRVSIFLKYIYIYIYIYIGVCVG